MKAARTASSRADTVTQSSETEGNAGSMRLIDRPIPEERLGPAFWGEGVLVSRDWTRPDEVHPSTDRNRQIIGLVRRPI
jgi:hypothetical protein